MDNWKNECPKRGTDEDTKANGEEKVVVDKHQKKSHGETADGQCEGGATAVGRVGSNSFMVLDCQRCKYAHKITYCPGCKVTGGVNHCLMVLPVKDRFDMVKSCKYCAICIHFSHTADTCFHKNKDS